MSLLEEYQVIMDVVVAYLTLAGFLIGGMLLLALAVCLIQGPETKSVYQVNEERTKNVK